LSLLSDRPVLDNAIERIRALRSPRRADGC